MRPLELDWRFHGRATAPRRHFARGRQRVDRQPPTSIGSKSIQRPPKVSVVIPCFNLGRFLDEAIQSVLDQTYSDFEILVVDDGSTDEETKRRLDTLATPRTCVIHSTNQGLSATRNLGIRNTSGEYVCALDADDRLAPTCLERSVRLLEANRELAFVSHWVDAFGDNDFQWKPVRCDLGILLDYNVVNGAALFRRSLVEAIGGFDELLREGCEDWEFWIRATEAGYTGVILPDILYQYRQRPDSMSRTMNRTGAYQRIYGELVQKHSRSYEHHLLDLVLRREWTFADVCLRIDALEQELTTRLEPALEERRRELEGARARLAELEARRRLEQEHDALFEEYRRLDHEHDVVLDAHRRLEHQRDAVLEAHDRLQREHDTLLERQRLSQHERSALVQSLAGIEEQARAVRGSWSWRMTSPLRRLYRAARVWRPVGLRSMTRRPATASLVVLAFGPDRVIERAVQSLARQTATDLEIVVVHDRANNAFLQRQVGTLADRYPTTFVVAAGSGPGARRQVGVQASHGRYFAIVDGAESFGATYFERACLALDEMPDAGFATTWGGFTPEDAKLDARVDLADLTASPWTVANATLVRRSSLDAAGGFDPSLPDFVEWDLLLTLAERGERGVLVPGAMLHRHPQDDVRLRESLRGERHLPAVRRIFDRHVASFERHAARALSQRDGNAKALWKSRGLDLVARRERLRTELDGVMNDLASVRGELKRYGRATLEWNDLRRATPLSRNWGLERGRPIDRHYIEGFVSEHAADIRGAVLEVLDSGLTEAYGGSRVRRSDVLDIDPGNHRATVIGDLRTAGQLPANAYDCFILTQTLHLVDDIEAAVVQAHRALKPGGVLLATLPCVSMVAEEYGAAGDHWRVTEAGARQLFERVFSPAMVQTRSRGNVLAATAFLYGLSCEEIELGELDADDPAYP